MGEDYTGSEAAVFEKVLTTPPDWISYSNMIASNNDMLSMSIKLVEMGLWPNTPAELSRGYFDMRFVEIAEELVRGNQ